MLFRSSLHRWAMVLLLAVIAFTVGGWWLWRGRAQESATADGAPMLSRHSSLRAEEAPGERADAATASRSRPSRSKDSTAAAEVRMRSLLDLKKEEMAYVELSPEAIHEVFPNLGAVAGGQDGLNLVSRVDLTPETRIKLIGMVRQGMPVTGRIDTSAVGMDRTGMSDLSWQSEDWKATGVYMPNSTTEQTLQLHFESEGKELLTTVTIPDGGAFIVLKGDGRGLMIVAGGESPEPRAGK